jgi:hypothetical protein
VPVYATPFTAALLESKLKTELKWKVNRQQRALDRPTKRKFPGVTLARHKREVRLWIAAKCKKRMME